MVSEKKTGYMIYFSTYTGAEGNWLVQRNTTMDPHAVLQQKL